MHRKYRLALAIASIVLFIVAMTATGVSYAVWTSPEGSVSGEGTTTVSPSVNANEGYVWAKYFNFETITEGNIKYAAITTFYADGAQAAGLNLADVYIPEVFWVKKDGTRLYVKDELAKLTAGKDYDVYTTKIITNRIFMDVTLKQLPVNVYIPSGVTKIETGAFSGLANLQKVVFYVANVCTIEPYAFVDCPKLTVVEKKSEGTISGTKGLSFVSCGKDPFEKENNI